MASIAPDRDEFRPGLADAPGARPPGEPNSFLYVFTAFALLGLVAVTLFPAGRSWIILHWQWPTVAFLMVLAWSLFRAWFKDAPSVQRAGIVTFVLIPLIVVFELTFVFLHPSWHIPLVRAVFLTVVCLLPGTLYFLFIATRRDSLLNEFVTTLVQLGLVQRRCVPAGPHCLPRPANGAETLADPVEVEDEVNRRRRVRTYLERFEAQYGQLPRGLVDQIVAETDPDRPETERMRISTASFEWTRLLTTGTTVPIIVATALIALGWLLTLPPQTLVAPEAVSAEVALEPGAGPPVTNVGDPLGAMLQEVRVKQATADMIAQLRNALDPGGFEPVHFAFLGAYFFSLQMLFRRYVRRDLGPRAYIGVAQRIILSVIGVWFALVFIEMFGDLDADASGLMVLAFAIGAFPQIVWQLLKAGTTRIPGVSLALPSVRTALPASDLEGLTIWHQARLEEEDIENIPNMATADVVELMLQTRVPPDRIIDWIDQAILYTHLGGDEEGQQARRTLRVHGIRTASGLIEAYRKAERRGDLGDLEHLLPKANGRSPIRSLVDTITTNPNLPLIYNWRGLASPTCAPAPA